ncbi:MAG: asparagine synthetase B family protein [Flammeovirgaceae bacterium]
MSGIYGIINFHQQAVAPEHLNRLSEALAHRAVDRQDTYLEGNVGLGHALMCLSPESHYEQQPLTYKHWIGLLDGRLFNREALLKQFDCLPSDYATTPDSVLVMKAYEKWQADCVHHLMGEFACFIYDTQAQTIYATKDRFGNRNFFYFLDEQRFCFASEITALLKLPFINKDLNIESTLLSYVSPFIDIKDHTFFKHINTLARAHFLKIDGGKKELKRYWSLSYKEPLKLSSDRDYVSYMHHTIQQTIADRIRIDGQVGVALSGGLDSSTVACIAAQQLAPSNKSLFASGFLPPAEQSGTVGDERIYMEAVAQQEKNIVFNPVSTTPPTREYQQFHLETYAFPHQFGSFCWHQVYQTLGEHQVRVMLTGFLGDDVISRPGKLVYKHLIHDKSWKRLFNVIQRRSKATQRHPLRVLVAEVLRPYIPSIIEQLVTGGSNDRTKHISHQDLYKRLILPTFLDSAQIDKHSTEVDHLLITSTIHQSISNIQNRINNQFSDAMSVTAHHHGIIFSTPLADLRIVEMAISMPPEKWLINGMSRGLIREATKGILPELVRMRQTKGYIVDEERLFFQQQLTNNINLIANTKSELWNFINKPALIQCLNEYQEHQQDAIFRVSDYIIQLMHFINFYQRNS